MKRLALFAFIASLAGACTASVSSEPTYARGGAGPRAERVQTRWVTLADRYSADSNRQQIAIRGQDAFRRIRIEGSRGAPVIKQVAIEFADTRDTQVIRMEERLAPGQGRTIDLNGGRRPVQRIIIYTAPEYGGSYSVYGV